MLRRFLILLAASAFGGIAVIAVDSAWNQRADDICAEKAPPNAPGYTLMWEWDEFAYVCDYRAPGAQQERVGLIDAFHGGGSQRHRPDR